MGQFASNQGYTHLIEACKGDKILTGFFDAGGANGKVAVAVIAAALRKVEGDADVKKTATGLADMMKEQTMVAISNGVGG